MSKEHNNSQLKDEFDISGFDLTNFESEEIAFLKKYGNYLEALTLGIVSPKTRGQWNFLDFIEPKRDDSFYCYTRKEIWPNNIQMKVWEKVLLSDEYYLGIQNDPQRLAVRNYFAYSHTEFFKINKFSKNLEVYLKIKGFSKIGGDEPFDVMFAYRFRNKINDKYIQSLFKHDRINEIVHRDTALSSYAKEGEEFLDSEEGISLQIDCKKIEVEMKLYAIKNYSLEDHKKNLHLDHYSFKEKRVDRFI